MQVIFDGTRVIFTRDKKIEIVGQRVGQNLYHLAVSTHDTDSSHQNSKEDGANLASSKTTTIDFWHKKLAHTSYKNILKMSSLQLVDGLESIETKDLPSQVCPGCAFGKMHRRSFPVGRTRAIEIGQLIHADLCGPMQVATPG